MDMDWSDPNPERIDELRDRDDSPTRDCQNGLRDDLEENEVEKSSKHRSKDRKKSRREEKDHRSKDRERSKMSDGLKEREKETKDMEKDRSTSTRERRKEDKDEREKDRNRDKARDKDYDKEKYRDKEREKDRDWKDRGKETEHEREREVDKESDRGRDKERMKEKNRDRDKDKEKGQDRAKDKDKEKEKSKSKDKEKERENDKDRDRDTIDKEKAKMRDKEKEVNQDRDRHKDKEKGIRKSREEANDRSKDGGKDDKVKLYGEDNRDRDVVGQGKSSHHGEDDNTTIELEKNVEEALRPQYSTIELQERMLRMKEERVKRKSESSSEVLAWVNRSRRIEEQRNSEKEKALQLKKIFEEQDNIDQGESDEEKPTRHGSKDLAGVKVLHGLEKVIEGGAVVLTLKDQAILANGELNEDVDMLENVEIGEQKRRDEAYKAAKKTTGIYKDKFNDEPGSEKKILPQYDDPVVDEGLTLDSSGRFTGEAEKKLEELRRRLLGVCTNNHFEDLNTYGKSLSDYYTHEEMLQFKKPKKKKCLRKKEKLNIDALEAEAVSAGLGVGDLGSRSDGKRQSMREEQERYQAEMRNNAYQSAYAKADEASKALRLDQTHPVQIEDNENLVFGEDDEDLQKSLQRARKLALQKQDDVSTSGPRAIALLASTTSSQNVDNQNPIAGESQESRVVFTEMEEFVWGLQLDDETHKPDGEDVFMDEDEVPKASDQETKDDAGGWTEVKDTDKDKLPVNENKEEIVPDDTIHEVAVGKGLSGALKLLKERGTLKEGIEWGGRNMDKKKSKLVGIYDNSGTKEIRIERTDEFGRIMTPKEAFRMISHKFHGKGPGKMKQEKRMKQYQEELKLKQMKNSDTPSQSVERMREAQARMKTPYLVLSGHVKPGQTSDPRSGFATVEDIPGSLTPMLGDRKVEHFLGIKRKAEPGNMGPPKKPKT